MYSVQILYLFAVLSANSDNAVKVNFWIVSFEAEHLHLELDLFFVAIVRDADGGVDWAARLKKNMIKWTDAGESQERENIRADLTRRILWYADSRSGESECGCGTGVAQHCSATRLEAPGEKG